RDRRGRLDDEGRVQFAGDQHQPAGHPEHGLLRGDLLRVLLLRGGVAGDGPHRPAELVLGDLHDLGGQAGGVGEGEDGGLVPDEQDGAGALLLRVAGGAAGRAVVTALGGLSGEQTVGFFVADLGAYLVADVEHARHGWLPRDAVRGRTGWLPARGPGGSPAHAEDNGRSVAGVTLREQPNRTIGPARRRRDRKPAFLVNRPTEPGCCAVRAGRGPRREAVDKSGNQPTKV